MKDSLFSIYECFIMSGECDSPIFSFGLVSRARNHHVWYSVILQRCSVTTYLGCYS